MGDLQEMGILWWPKYVKLSSDTSLELKVKFTRLPVTFNCAGEMVLFSAQWRRALVMLKCAVQVVTTNYGWGCMIRALGQLLVGTDLEFGK